MKKFLKILLPILIVLLCSAYIGAWIYSARWFDREIARAYETAGENDIQFLGPKPKLENFPFVPQLRYSGGIKSGDTEILFPAMVVRGYPFPGFSLTATFPLSIMLGGNFDPKVWQLDYLQVKFAVPDHLPADLTQEDMAAWKNRDGKIEVQGYEVRKGALNAKGKGLLMLDDNLQPAFNFESRITGHDRFIEDQLQAGTMQPFPAAIARGVFGSLARPDGETGENTVTVNVNAQNRLLRVGPATVLELPLISWGTHTPPDLHL